MYENFTIFEGLSADEIKSVNPSIREFAKDSIIVCEGDRVSCFGMVVSGTVQVYNEDFYGNKNIILTGSAGFIFGEALAVLGYKDYPVSVVASSDCKIMFIQYKPVLASKLSVVMAKSNMEYRSRVTLLSQRTTRDKILFYLLGEAKKAQSNSFSIPFDRQQLADYLCVERSAMSAEISKLVKEGVLETNKNWFCLIRK